MKLYLHDTTGKHFYNDEITTQNEGKRKKRNIESEEAAEQQYSMSNNSSENYMFRSSGKTFNRIYDRRDKDVKDNEENYAKNYPKGYPWTVRILNRYVFKQEGINCDYASDYCFRQENERVFVRDITSDKIQGLHGDVSYTQCNGVLITHQGGPSHIVLIKKASNV